MVNRLTALTVVLWLALRTISGQAVNPVKGDSFGMGLPTFARALSDAGIPAGFHVKATDFPIPAPLDGHPGVDSLKAVESLERAFDDAYPRYQLTVSGGTVTVSLRAWLNDPSNVLDSPVRNFHIEDTPMVVAAEGEKLLKPQIVIIHGGAASVMFSVGQPPPEVKLETISVNIDDGSLHDIFDAIVRAKPGLVWVWRQTSNKPIANSAQLSFVSPEGQTMMFPPLRTGKATPFRVEVGR